MRRSFTFTIGVMLCATLAAGAHAQTDQSSGGKTLVDLEAQAKAKKKAESAKQTTSTATATTKTKRKKAGKKGAGTASAKPAATATSDPPSTPQSGTATEATPTTQAAPTMQAAPASPAPSAAAPAAPPDPNGRKIYKAGDIPDAWKFEKEKATGKKPVSEGAGPATTPGSGAASAAAPAAAAVRPAVAAAPPAAAAAPPAVAAAPPAAAAPADVPAEAPAASASTASPPVSTASPPTPAPAASASTASPAAPTPAPEVAPTAAVSPPMHTTPAVAPRATAATATQDAAETDPVQPSAGRGTASRRGSSGAQGWRDRGYISANFGWQSSSTTFTDARTLPLLTGDGELRQMTSSYDVKAGPMFDIGVGVRLVKSLGVAVSVTRFSVSNNIAIDGTVPHPFFFNRLRPLSGTTPGTREELAVHVDGVWVVPGRKLQVAIFGGPTFFNAKQTVVNDYTYSDVYPFDAPPTFTAGVSAEQSKTATGFNAGADIGYFFTDIFGVGGVLRFSRGTLKSSIGDLDLGGPQVSAGVRIRLRQGGPSAKKPAVKRPAGKKT